MKINIDMNQYCIILVVIKISLMKFKEGGHLILKAQNKNQNIDILGIILINPLLIKNLRLKQRS